MSPNEITPASPQEPWDLLLSQLEASPGLSANDAVRGMARILVYLGRQVAELRARADATAAVAQLDLRATALAKARKHVAEVVKGAQSAGRYSESAKLTYKDQLSEELRVADFLLGKKVV